MLEHLSMGMSNDFEVAIEEGATIVRLGSVLFGDAPKVALRVEIQPLGGEFGFLRNSAFISGRHGGLTTLTS